MDIRAAARNTGGKMRLITLEMNGLITDWFLGEGMAYAVTHRRIDLATALMVEKVKQHDPKA